MDEASNRNVIPMPGQTPKKRVERRWGKQALKLGFTLVPNGMIEAQKALELSAADFNLLIQLLSFWWYVGDERAPFPSKETLGARLGLDPRQVQRRIHSLEERGWIDCERRPGRQTIFHLEPVVARVRKVSARICKERDEAKAAEKERTRRRKLAS